MIIPNGARPAAEFSANGPQKVELLGGGLGSEATQNNAAVQGAEFYRPSPKKVAVTSIRKKTYRQRGVPKSSWRDVLPIHPATDLFPMMSTDELLLLGEDIKKNGLRSRIAVIENSNDEPILIDGRNRLAAMELAGLKIVLEDVVKFAACAKHKHDFDIYSYVISANIHRRHLTAEQRRELIAKVLKAKPEQSNRKIAEQVKVDHKTVSSVRNDLEAIGQIPQLKRTVGKDGKERPAKKLPTKSRKNDTASNDPTQRQLAVLKNLWRMNNTLRAAWLRSNQQTQRQFISWLDSGPLDDECGREFKAVATA